MHDVLKLYFGLRAKCLWRMMKELRLMVIPALLLLLFVGTLIVIKLISAPIYFSILLYVSLLLACHSMRGDSAFLYSIFGVGHTKLLFLVEYMLLKLELPEAVTPALKPSTSPLRSASACAATRSFSAKKW